MTSFSYRDFSSIEYSHMTINRTPVGSFENYTELLQNSIESCIHYLQSSFVRIEEYFKNAQRNEYVDDLEEVFLRARKKFDNEGIKLRDQLIDQLSSKSIDSENYSHLQKIITAHHKMAVEMIEKELDNNRVEMIARYVREMIVYLKADFRVSNLPEMESKKEKVQLTSDVFKDQFVIDYRQQMMTYEMHQSA